MFDFKRRPISVFSSPRTGVSKISVFSPRPKVNQTDSPYLNIEREVITQNGGVPTERNLGPDGHSRMMGKPMEVKYATKGRFRVNRIDHQKMLAQGGLYILVNAAGQQMKMPAWQLDKLLRYRWLFDRNPRYAHSFLYSKDLPNNFGGQ